MSAKRDHANRAKAALDRDSGFAKAFALAREMSGTAGKGKDGSEGARRAALEARFEKMAQAGWLCSEDVRTRGLWDLVMWAKSLPMARSMLGAGQRPWVEGRNWRHTPLGMSVWFGWKEAALELSRDLTKDETRLAQMTDDSFFFDILTQWDKASGFAGELAGIWVSKGWDPSEGPNGEGPLHHAARYGMKDAARVLLDAGADPDGRSKRSGRTVLHSAAEGRWGSEEGKAGLAGMLLAAGADPSDRDAEGQTAEGLAVASESMGLVRLLRGVEMARRQGESLASDVWQACGPSRSGGVVAAV